MRIPEEDLPFLFTPFYRVEKSRNKATGGSGLGLYLVHAIATMHGFPAKSKTRTAGSRPHSASPRSPTGHRAPQTKNKSTPYEIKTVLC